MDVNLLVDFGRGDQLLGLANGEASYGPLVPLVKGLLPRAQVPNYKILGGEVPNLLIAHIMHLYISFVDPFLNLIFGALKELLAVVEV